MAHSTKKPTGYIIYRGPSLLDGSPIVAVAITSKSRNDKTGNMVQTYILRDGAMSPTEAVREGYDVGICGDCKHRPSTGGACYVVVAQGPMVVWKGVQSGRYPLDDGYMAQTAATGRMVRLGTYGDPAAVPSEVWERLLRNAAGRTGYTHQWRNGDVPQAQLDTLRRLVMASVDTPDELEYARQLGWRTFRVRLESEALAQREFVCPASEEAGKRTTCAQCAACDGIERGMKASPTILAHGGKARKFIAIRAA